MTAPIKLSGGFLNELSFIYLATGLIETSQDIEKEDTHYDELVSVAVTIISIKSFKDV